MSMFEAALNGLRARLANYLKRYGYKPLPRLNLLNPEKTFPEEVAARVGAAIMAIGFMAEEAASMAAWAAKEGKEEESYATLVALRALTGVDLMELVGVGKTLSALNRDEITLLAERAGDEARKWAGLRLADALDEADRAYKEAVAQ